MFKNKTVYSLLAGLIGFIGFFFAFAVASGFGYSAGSSGFSTAFDFANFGTVLVFFALLACVAGFVLAFLRMSKIGGICFFAAALFCLFSAFFVGSGSFGMVSSGFGTWFSFVFFLAAGAFELFGDAFHLPILPIPGLNADAGHSSYAARPSRPVSTTGGPTAFCSNCGAKIDANARFCPICGAKR